MPQAPQNLLLMQLLPLATLLLSSAQPDSRKDAGARPQECAGDRRDSWRCTWKSGCSRRSLPLQYFPKFARERNHAMVRLLLSWFCLLWNQQEIIIKILQLLCLALPTSLLCIWVSSPGAEAFPCRETQDLPPNSECEHLWVVGGGEESKWQRKGSPKCHTGAPLPKKLNQSPGSG